MTDSRTIREEGLVSKNYNTYCGVNAFAFYQLAGTTSYARDLRNPRLQAADG